MRRCARDSKKSQPFTSSSASPFTFGWYSRGGTQMCTHWRKGWVQRVSSVTTWQGISKIECVTKKLEVSPNAAIEHQKVNTPWRQAVSSQGTHHLCGTSLGVGHDPLEIHSHINPLARGKESGERGKTSSAKGSHPNWVQRAVRQDSHRSLCKEILLKKVPSGPGSGLLHWRPPLHGHHGHGDAACPEASNL